MTIIKEKTVLTNKIFVFSLTAILTIGLFAPNIDSAFADKESEIEEILDRYALNAEENHKAKKEKLILEEVREQEMKRPIVDTKRLTEIQDAINNLDDKINDNVKKAQAIQNELNELLKMPDELRETLKEAKQIIVDNRELVPYSGLGITSSTQSLEIWINEDSAVEKYLSIIQELVGEDVPVTIKEATGERITCSSRSTDCSYLQGGLQISDDSTFDCTLGFPVNDGSDYGFLTAGHCFDEDDEIYQPTTSYGKIGDVDELHFEDDGDCDCAFIHQSSLDVWDEGTVYKASSDEYNGIIYKTDPGLNAIIAFSGADSDTIDWGYVDSLDYTCTDDGIDTVEVMLTRSTDGDLGDSGAPVFNPNVDAFYGTAICRQSGDHDIIFTPWSNLVDNLGVS